MNKKILYLIIGICAILLGICCLFDDKLPVILCGIGLLLYGAGQFFAWRERRKAGAASVWALAGMLAAVAFGVLILIGSRAGSAAIRFVLICLSIWLIGEGVLEVLGAVMYRIQGEYFIDGMYHDNLPVRLALSMGATELIVVDLHQKPQHPEYAGQANVMYLTPSGDLGGILAFDRKKIHENIEMGYQDTIRKFSIGQDCGSAFARNNP